MPELGSAELLVILAVALLLFGPRRLAGWAGANNGKPPQSGVPGHLKGGLRENGSSRFPPPPLISQRTGPSPRENPGDPAPSSSDAAARGRGVITDLPPEPEPAARTISGPPPPGSPAGDPSSGEPPPPRPLRPVPRTFPSSGGSVRFPDGSVRISFWRPSAPPAGAGPTG